MDEFTEEFSQHFFCPLLGTCKTTHPEATDSVTALGGEVALLFPLPFELESEARVLDEFDDGLRLVRVALVVAAIWSPASLEVEGTLVSSLPMLCEDLLRFLLADDVGAGDAEEVEARCPDGVSELWLSDRDNGDGDEAVFVAGLFALTCDDLGVRLRV